VRALRLSARQPSRRPRRRTEHREIGVKRHSRASRPAHPGSKTHRATVSPRPAPFTTSSRWMPTPSVAWALARPAGGAVRVASENPAVIIADAKGRSRGGLQHREDLFAVASGPRPQFRGQSSGSLTETRRTGRDEARLGHTVTVPQLRTRYFENGPGGRPSHDRRPQHPDHWPAP
jgi:hypothetical protein